MHPLLTYTLLAACAAVVVFAVWVADKPEHPRLGQLARYAIVLQLAGLLGVYAVLRPGPGDNPAASLAQATASQRPVFLAFHSNYCGACLYARPSVDQLAHDLGDDAVVSRLNIDDDDSLKLFRQHHFRAVPAFVLLDADGKELYRQEGGTPDKDAVLALAERVNQAR